MPIYQIVSLKITKQLINFTKYNLMIPPKKVIIIHHLYLTTHTIEHLISCCRICKNRILHFLVEPQLNYSKTL